MPAPVQHPGVPPRRVSAKHRGDRAQTPLKTRQTKRMLTNKLRYANLNMSAGLAPDGCLTLKGNTMVNRNAIKAEAGVLVPVYEKDGNGKPVFAKDKAGNVVKDKEGNPVRKVAEFVFENAFYHPHIPKSKWIKLDDTLLVARMFRDFTAAGAKINRYCIFLPANGKSENGWELLSLADAVKLVEDGARELVIDTPIHGSVKEGEGIYRQRRLRLNLRLPSEKKVKNTINADDYFDVAAFYTQKTKK